MRLKTTSKSLPRSKSSCTVRSKQRRIYYWSPQPPSSVKVYVPNSNLHSWLVTAARGKLPGILGTCCCASNLRSQQRSPNKLIKQKRNLNLPSHTHPTSHLQFVPFPLLFTQVDTYPLRDGATGFLTLPGGKFCELRYLRLYGNRTWFAILGPLICFESHVPFYSTSGARTFTAVASFVSG